MEVFFDVKIGGFHAGFQVVEESKGVQVLKEDFYFGEFFVEVLGYAEIGGGEAVKVFEHASCCTRGGDEFQDFFPAGECAILFFVAFDFFVAETEDATVVGSGGGIEMAFGEAGFKIIYLVLHNLGSEPHLTELLKVLPGWFKYHAMRYLGLEKDLFGQRDFGGQCLTFKQTHLGFSATLATTLCNGDGEGGFHFDDGRGFE